MRLGVLRFTDVTESALTEAAIIINGTERVVVSQGRAQNRPRVCTRPPSIVAYSHAAGGNPWCLYDFSQYQSTLRTSASASPTRWVVSMTRHHAPQHHYPLFVLVPCSPDSDEDILMIAVAGSPDGHFVYKESRWLRFDCGSSAYTEAGLHSRTMTPRLATSSTATMPFGVAFALPRSCCRNGGPKLPKWFTCRPFALLSC
jgi:hypothetical protein